MHSTPETQVDSVPTAVISRDGAVGSSVGFVVGAGAGTSHSHEHASPVGTGAGRSPSHAPQVIGQASSDFTLASSLSEQRSSASFAT